MDTFKKYKLYNNPDSHTVINTEAIVEATPSDHGLYTDIYLFGRNYSTRVVSDVTGDFLKD